MTAPLPTGGYALKVTGYSGGDDVRIRADLLLRPAGSSDGGTEMTIASADGPPPPGDTLHSRTWIDTTVCGSAVGAAGDGLILRISHVGGTSFFGSISADLSLP